MFCLFSSRMIRWKSTVQMKTQMNFITKWNSQNRGCIFRHSVKYFSVSHLPSQSFSHTLISQTFSHPFVRLTFSHPFISQTCSHPFVSQTFSHPFISQTFSQ